MLVFEQADFQLATAADVVTEAKANFIGRNEQLRIHLDIARFDEQIVVRPRVFHVAADRDRAGKYAVQNLADLAALGVKVLVELQMSALRCFEDDRVARRRGALVARRGKHHQREVGHVDAVVVVPHVVVQHEHHRAAFDHFRRSLLRPVVGREIGGQDSLVFADGVLGIFAVLGGRCAACLRATACGGSSHGTTVSTYSSYATMIATSVTMLWRRRVSMAEEEARGRRSEVRTVAANDVIPAARVFEDQFDDFANGRLAAADAGDVLGGLANIFGGVSDGDAEPTARIEAEIEQVVADVADLLARDFQFGRDFVDGRQLVVDALSHDVQVQVGRATADRFEVAARDDAKPLTRLAPEANAHAVADVEDHHLAAIVE